MGDYIKNGPRGTFPMKWQANRYLLNDAETTEQVMEDLPVDGRRCLLRVILTLFRAAIVSSLFITHAVGDALPAIKKNEHTDQRVPKTMMANGILSINSSSQNEICDAQDPSRLEPSASLTSSVESPEKSNTSLLSANSDFWRNPKMPVYLQALTACVLMFSTFVSWRVARISKFNVQVDAYQKLRNAFVLLSPNLPRQFWSQQCLPDNYEQLCAMQRYWYQSFDEWFITQVLHPKTLGHLWRAYYKDSIFKNRGSPAMIAALIRTKEGTDAIHFDQFFKLVTLKRRLPKKYISTYQAAIQLAACWDAHLDAQIKKTTPSINQQ
ncbi:hypothetical protein P5705_24275 [Pseudomonas entomophila]|uniref:hypothetical protein n=1 Tax=Pseudomonas entomophila TaxID=312306 RepID=UPI0024052094|nr:hypothetical protein [Pseudomonas entomophila]MDF9620775.1 hypothetical protein [Pseudomonas entomophila]